MSVKTAAGKNVDVMLHHGMGGVTVTLVVARLAMAKGTITAVCLSEA